MSSIQRKILRAKWKEMYKQVVNLPPDAKTGTPARRVKVKIPFKAFLQFAKRPVPTAEAAPAVEPTPTPVAE